MNRSRKIVIGLLSTISLIMLNMDVFAQANPIDSYKMPKIKGIALSATPQKYDSNPMLELMALNTEWIAVVPYAHASFGETVIDYNTNPEQWWGERPEGIRETIRLAHKAGLKVMLKPQIYMHDGWVGHLNFETEKEWLEWERNFEEYTLIMMNIANEMNVELFCMATEFKESTRWRIKFWEQLINKCRNGYGGLLTYSANWDYYEEIPFWHLMDFIGVSAYFPLLADKTPTTKNLMNEWKPIKFRLKNLAELYNKPLIFTEFGYLSVDGGAYKAWLLEKQVNELNVNEETQFNAIEAVYKSFWNEDYWAGGFLWKWFPNGKGHTGYPQKDYSPRGKKAEHIIEEWFGNN